MPGGHSSAKRFCVLGIWYDDVQNVDVNIEKENKSIILPHKVHAVGGREQQWRNCTIAQLIAGVGRKPPILHSDEFPDFDTSTVQTAEFASECGESASGESASGESASGKSASGESAFGGVSQKKTRAMWKHVCESVCELHDDDVGFYDHV